MKPLARFLLFVALFTVGCMTARVTPPFDLESPFTVTVHENGKYHIPTEANALILTQTIKFWLPRMVNASTTYPTHQYSLRVKGMDNAGNEFEDFVLVGSNWIGDGNGVARLADTQVFKLSMAIRETIANQAVDVNASNAPR